MNKLYVLIVFLLPIIALSQQPKISPYYPDNPNFERHQTQFTYFDLNYVNFRVQNYLEKNSGMVLMDTKFNLKDGHGIAEFIYKESMVIGSNRKPYTLHFNYTVAPIENDLVITKCKITGQVDKLIAFYVGFWKTSLQFDEIKRRKEVYNHYLQDRVSFFFNNGNPYVIIENETSIDFQKFKEEYEMKKTAEEKRLLELEKEKKLKAQQKQEQLEIDRKQQAEKDKQAEEKRQKQLNTKVLNSSVTIEKKKNKLQFQGKVSDGFLQDVEEFLKDKENGTYLLQVSTTYEYEVEIKNDFRIYRYTPPKNLKNTILNRF
ncbi:hypothetical protein EI546_06475 [Aequorivita sp. H23M31]|uniref:DUF4468 domain-containing protein n=1 Tax=Aequorivita ciconiae TaxID=2494375 RepID=A0A410G2E1_9FLAO|nr:hypothetical protein [Aequorivita sp. H23M31]QAA81395.1 hypothetical protein EI546_06475 [Aequorivita sp. H23M31]